MYLIAGLGNPDKKYLFTRHNAGFLAMDYLSQKCGIAVKKSKFRSLIGEGTIGGKRVILAKPQTYMNNSGEAIGQICGFYKIPNENIIILYDDISLEPGRLRIRRKGSAGGHNGIKSIILHLNSEEFLRVKIGVGGPQEQDLVDYVLGEFPKAEQETMFESFRLTAEAVEEIIKNGVDSAMNRYNLSADVSRR